MIEDKRDVVEIIWTGIRTLISSVFWLIGTLALLASVIGTISSLTGAYSNSEFYGVYILLNFLSLEGGLISLTTATLFIKKSFFVDSKGLYYISFRYSYYFTYFLGTIGYIAITLMDLSLLDVEKLEIRNISDVIVPIIFIATFILFQASFIRIHRLFLSQKQSNLKTNN
jgi:hypothetical protein